MKKSLLGLLVLVFFIAVLSVSVNALPSNLGICDSNNLNEVKMAVYDNNCGSANYECVYIKCPRGVSCFFQGYIWRFKECILSGNGTCCKDNCGYKSTWEKCDSCKTCDTTGSCTNNIDDWTFCSEDDSQGICTGGECNLDTSAPVIEDNQENIYIRDISNRDEIKSILIDLNFEDDIQLREYKMRLCDEDSSQYFANRSEYFPAPEIIDGCAVETRSLEGTRDALDWELSEEMWDWILDTVLNQGKVSMNIDLFDKIGNVALGNQLFYIISDFTNPTINVSHSISDVPEGKAVKITASAEDMFEEVEIEIFIDGEKFGESCASSPCEKTRVYNAGAHTYYAFAKDPSGNNATSSTGTFTFETEPSTCDELFGSICGGNDVCDQEEFTTSDTSKCCPGSCLPTSTLSLESCNDQNGTIFNPGTHECGGNEVSASNLNGVLRCCTGEVKEIPDLSLLNVQWEDANGNKLAIASLGDHVKCSASGVLGTVNFNISIGEVMKSEILTLPNQLDFVVNEVGVYKCEVTLNGESKSSELRIVNLPATPKQTALPGFSALNGIMALSFILVYYIILIKFTKKKW